LVGVGGTYDLRTIWWNARLPLEHPTMEIRVCLAQLDAPSSLLLAALTRAVVTTALRDSETDVAPIDIAPELLDAGLWHTAREAVQSNLLNPVSGTLESSTAVTAALLHYCGDAIDEGGNRDRIVALLARTRQLGTGERQRAALRAGGQSALAALFEHSLTAHD